MASQSATTDQTRVPGQEKSRVQPPYGQSATLARAAKWSYSTGTANSCWLTYQDQSGTRSLALPGTLARKRVPSALPRRKISYCRYADDYLVVLCQCSKAEAQELKAEMAKWLQEQLGLTQHPQKTNITHWDKRLRFLGYDLRGQRNLNGTRWLRLSIPSEKERTLKAKVKHLCGYTQIPELDLVMSVNAQMRGWTQYYRYANNAQRHFAHLTGVVYWLGAHYIGRKHRCSIKRVMRRHYGIDPTSGRRALYTRNSKGEQVFLWNKPPQRQTVYSRTVGAKDSQPLVMASWGRGHSIAQRQALLVTKQARCDVCGQSKNSAELAELDVHHPNRLGRRRKRQSGPANVIASGEEQEVKLLCSECHKRHHAAG